MYWGMSVPETRSPFVSPHTIPRQDGEIHVSINSGTLMHDP